MGLDPEGRALTAPLTTEYRDAYSVGYKPGNIVPPLAHSIMDGIHYRMYVENINDIYHVHADVGLVRRYNAENLPNLIKEAIAFANSFPVVETQQWFWGNVYENYHHPDLDMIGWRTHHTTPALMVYRRVREAYIIVVTRKFIEELCG